MGDVRDDPVDAEKVAKEMVALFRATAVQVKGLDPHLLEGLGITRAEAFRMIFSEAAATYRGEKIDVRRAREKVQGPTESQLKYIEDLAKRKIDGRDLVLSYLRRVGKKSVEELTKDEASELIDLLKGSGL